MLIINASVVLDGSIFPNHCLAVRDNEIERIAHGDLFTAADRAEYETIDAKGNFVSAGFIDLHIHGIHEFLVNNGNEALAEICKILPTYGVTGFLPTLTPLPPGQDTRLLENLASCAQTGAHILGFHLEGPFLSLTGALPREALADADRDRAKNLMEAAKPYKVIFSISPEKENITDLLRIMTADNTPAFMTHTRADVRQTLDAIRAGARHATHFYDVFHVPGTSDAGVRPCGAVEAILAEPDVSVDFILDGVHVDPIAVKMAMRCKAADKICLITDANIGAGLGPARYALENRFIEIADYGAPARLADGGGLAGSGLTMNRAVKNAVDMLDIDLPRAVQMASANPAKALGLERKGLLKTGFDADIVMFDADLKILKTWVNGICRYEKEG